MSEESPKLAQLNLGAGTGAQESGAQESGPHAELSLPGGFILELDTVESARVWHAGVRDDPASGRVVIGFSLPSRAAVDEPLRSWPPEESPG